MRDRVEDGEKDALKEATDGMTDHGHLQPLRQLRPVREHVNVCRGHREGQREQPRRRRLLQPKLDPDPQPPQQKPQASGELRDSGPLNVKAGRAGEVPEPPRSPTWVNVAELFEKREVGNACEGKQGPQERRPGVRPDRVPPRRQYRLQ